MTAASRRQFACQSATGAIIDQLESRVLLAAHPTLIWQIDGDRSGKATDDSIVLSVAGKSDSNVVASVNGKVVGVRPKSRLAGIQINGLRGQDDISIDFGAGDATIPVTMNGGAGDDSIQGGTGRDAVDGGGGNDTIDGGPGNDTICGGAGNDLLSGDTGRDFVAGDAGNDTLAGGMGNDWLSGDAGNDKLSGGWGKDILDGDIGRDVLRGGQGDDSLDGGRDINIIYRETGDHWHHRLYDTSRADVHDNPLVKMDNQTALKQWIIDAAVQRWQWALGQSAYWWRYPPLYAASGGLGSAVADNGAAVGAPSHSETNNQVKGVDEADLVKTDGNYLYLVEGNKLIIMNAWPADQTRIVWQTTLDDWPNGIYLNGDRLAVISQKWDYPAVNGGVVSGISPASTGGMSGGVSTQLADTARVGFMPIWRGTPQTVLTVYDVTDRTAPRVISQTTLDGSVSSSRDIDGKLYMVVDNSVNAPDPKILTAPDSTTADPKYVYEDEASYRARLDAMDLSQLLPQYTSTATAPDGTQTTTTGALVTAADLWVPANTRDQTSMFTIALFDLAGDAGALLASASAVGFSGTIYSSADNMYVTTQAWDSPMGSWTGDYRTDIYQFKLGADSIDLAGNGDVPGWAINQFSMDENNGYFRIATTSQQDGLSNNVFTMQDQGDTLKIVGGLTELAMGERIYAARFVGDAAYLVTFKQIDPLLAIDLSNPTKPDLRGVLEMPGYSSYLHPVNDNLLIGFGRNADAAGHVQGLQVSLFDVSNLADPKRIDVMQLSGGGGWWSGGSAAEWDHHAFSYFPDQGVLALPVLDSGWWNGDAKLTVIKVDPATGFTKLGQIEHQGEVLRSVQIGDYLYSIGTDAVKVVSINDPSQELADVAIPQDPTPPVAVRI